MAGRTPRRNERPDHDGTHRLAFERNKKKIYATQTVCGICGKPVDSAISFRIRSRPASTTSSPSSKADTPATLTIFSSHISAATGPRATSWWPAAERLRSRLWIRRASCPCPVTGRPTAADRGDDPLPLPSPDSPAVTGNISHEKEESPCSQTRGMAYLRRKLELKRSRVLTRYKYYEMKNAVKDFGMVTPPEFRTFSEVLGWCGKAVDSLADRLIFREFRQATST